MKLQLNEDTLNAYINEAIKQELNEGVWSRLANFFGEKAAKQAAKQAEKLPILKKAAAASRQKAAGGSKTLVGKSINTGKAARDVSKYNKALVKSGKVKPEEVKELNNLQKLKRQGKLTPEQSKRLTSLEHSLSGRGYLTSRAEAIALRRGIGQQAAIAGVAGAVGGAYALGNHHGKNNPDAPWNDGVADPGMNGDAQDETGGNDGGFDGTFPWDDTTPNWTPRRPKTPAPAAEGTPAEPERPKTPEWAYQPVSTINGQTGVTGTGETQQGLKQHPENYVDSAKRVMLQTASAGLAGNTGNPKLDNWKQTNRNTRRTASDAIDTMRRDGAITRNQARQDKRALKDTEKMIRRNAKDMQNNY